jgi:hypothetical protein
MSSKVIKHNLSFDLERFYQLTNWADESLAPSVTYPILTLYYFTILKCFYQFFIRAGMALSQSNKSSLYDAKRTYCTHF